MTRQWIVVVMLGIVILMMNVPVAQAEDLPAAFVLDGIYRFADQEPNNVGMGIPSIEMGPDGKLWLFEPFVRVKGRYFEPGEIQVLDPVDGIFLNGNDVLSSRFGSTNSGAIFLPDGQLLVFAAKWPSAVMRDPVDGKFFNGNDKETKVQWPFGALETVGTPEPSPAALGPSGIFYFPVPVKNQIAVFDPEDGNLSSEQFSFRLVDLPPAQFGQRPMGIAFDSSGHLFLVSRRFRFSQEPNQPAHTGPALIGLDAGVDRQFFTKDDRLQHYDVVAILAEATPEGRPPLIIDMAFDPSGALLLFDARYKRLYRFVPADSRVKPSLPLSVLFRTLAKDLGRAF